MLVNYNKKMNIRSMNSYNFNLELAKIDFARHVEARNYLNSYTEEQHNGWRCFLRQEKVPDKKSLASYLEVLQEC